MCVLPIGNCQLFQMIRTNFRRARDVLLSVVGEFMSRASTRLTELAKKQSIDIKNIELLDVKCHIRLADIAHSLLKVSPYDPDTMACRGLQRYVFRLVLSLHYAFINCEPFAQIHAMRATESGMGQRCIEGISFANCAASGQIISENLEETINSSESPATPTPLSERFLINFLFYCSAIPIGRRPLAFSKVFTRQSYGIRTYCIGSKSKPCSARCKI